MLYGVHEYNKSIARPNNIQRAVDEKNTLDSAIAENLSFFFDHTENYAAYRQHYHKSPGVPFLIPHLKDGQRNGESALHPLFEFLQI